MAPGTNLESDDIVFFNDFLDDEALSAMYSVADFYLCTSVAEGQNLPLLEAMAHGVIPVTPRHSAMLDYIDDGHAIIIPHRRVPNDCEHFAACAALKPFQINRCGFAEVAGALERSTRLSERTRRRMSARAVASVREGYSHDAVWPLLLSRLETAARA